MITRKEVGAAYECCQDTVRVKIRAAGIKHQRRLTLEEFRSIIKLNGWPRSKQYQYLAELAMDNPLVLSNK